MSASMQLDLAAITAPPVGLFETELTAANALLTDWGHYLGINNRPFGAQAWRLEVAGEPVSIAVSASIVSSTAAGYPMQQVVELARLCTRPDSRWATRVMLRLWREVGGPAWPYWKPLASVAYSDNSRHPGHIYRTDGWTRMTETAGSSGGGTWSTKRDNGHPARGPKTLWLWEYPADAQQSQAA